MSRGGRRGTRKLREARPEGGTPQPRANAKSKLCRYNATGRCANGALCNFAHGVMELQLRSDHGIMLPELGMASMTGIGLQRSFVHSNASFPDKPSWASACEASEGDEDDVSTCFSDGEGLSTSPGFSRMSTEDDQGAAGEVEGACGGGVYAPARAWRGCPGVMVKNTFLQFGVTGHAPSSSLRRARSLT